MFRLGARDVADVEGVGFGGHVVHVRLS